MKIFFRILLLLFLLLFGYLLLAPVPIEPRAWTAPVAPSLSEGAWAVNKRLQVEVFSLKGLGIKPEHVTFDAQGRIYTGAENGTIVRFQPDGSQPEKFAQVPGRPLGIEPDGAGGFVVASAGAGLFALDSLGQVRLLTDRVPGEPPFLFANDVAISHSGVIYFTDASRRFPISTYKDDVLEHSCTGSLLKYDPATQTTTRLADGLCFANGLDFGPGESSLLINETDAYRVMRYGLQGEKAGQMEVFAENLPGFPDGLSVDGETVWVALANPRNPLLDKLLPYPFLRKMVRRLPEAIQPQPVMYGFVIGLNLSGEAVQNIQNPAGPYAPITSVRRYGDYLYMGNLALDHIARMRLDR